MWKDLEERFSQGSAPRIYQMKTEMVNTLQQGMSVSAYYTKLKGIWDELNTYSQIPMCTYGSAQAFAVEREKEKVHQFLMGLNEKYNTHHDYLLLRQQHFFLATGTKSTTIAGKNSSKPKATNSSQRMEPVEGNTIPINGLTTEQYAQLISMLNLEKTHNSTANFPGKAALLSNCTIEWILDSDASDHMTCHASVIASPKAVPKTPEPNPSTDIDNSPSSLIPDPNPVQPQQLPPRTRKLPSHFRDFYVDLPGNNGSSPTSSNHTSSGYTAPLGLPDFVGKWELVSENSGVSAMHGILLPKIDKVLILSTTHGAHYIRRPHSGLKLGRSRRSRRKSQHCEISLYM
ncbi:hypothetical protein Pint_13233 [Pistacia integerrima]|uniref:Uncharacterized protein n=1 Tax=Pistacia integerrima TaxID=434235 RepID=A0ACC0Y4D9_9ROSI|nr:hypothetical protein Pint_13233 [Pistacia integerrima]